MIIKILGSGCKNCEKLESHAKEALSELGLKAEVVKVTDFAEIANFGVAKTPALVVDEKVLISGRVPEISEIKDLLGSN